MTNLVRVGLIVGAIGLALGVAGAPKASAASCPGGTYYVTERFGGKVVKVVVDATCSAATTDFVTGLPSAGPDSIVFDHHGHVVISNPDVETLTLADATTGAIINAHLNDPTVNGGILFPQTADLAMDPNSDNVWAIGYGNGGIATVNSQTGATHIFADFGHPLGGIAFSTSGRLFVSTHDGYVFELDPMTGAVLDTLSVGGFLDGMSYDSYSGRLFISGCSGFCEVAVTPSLSFVASRVLPYSSDGVSANGKGQVIWVGNSSLNSFNEADSSNMVLAGGIYSADDSAPASGAGASTATPELGSGELLGTGLLPLGLALLVRRRRARRAPQQ